MAFTLTDPQDDALIINLPGVLRSQWAAIQAQTESALLITNAKVAVGAGIEENKLLFSGSGHGHASGTDGKLIVLTTSVSGVLPIANGGTGSASGVGNADTVDNYHASATATANKLLALGANKKFPSSTGLLGNNIVVNTGTIAHGGTIPLPSGYTQAQCKWFVPYFSVSSLAGCCPPWSEIQISVSANRVVVAREKYTTWTSVTVGYIIIGIK